MKPLFRQLAVLIGAAGFCVSVQATTVVEQTPTAHVRGRKAALAAEVAAALTPNAASVGLLRNAYGLLSSADHDYKGHRARAMRQIEDAARVFGVNLRGEGKGKEKQGASDSQVRDAESLLEQAQGGLIGKPLHHVREAINQLTVALNTR